MLLFFKNKRMLGSRGIFIGIKHSVSRHPLLGRDEADSFNLRGETISPFIRREMRRVWLT